VGLVFEFSDAKMN